MKEEYIKQRNSKKLNNKSTFFYEYYLENGGIPIGMEGFFQIFSFFDINEILQNIDKRFELNKLYDRDGKFIKIVE